MATDSFVSIILFDGFNEIALPKAATLHQIEINGYEISLQFKTNQESEIEYRNYYVAFNNAPMDYDQGILRLLKAIEFADGTSLAMVYEVYPYELG